LIDLWIFPVKFPGSLEPLLAFYFIQGSVGGPVVPEGVYIAVGVTARVEERVGLGVGETTGCGVGLAWGVLVGGGWVGKGVLVAGMTVGGLIVGCGVLDAAGDEEVALG
jgi:hypothetical protein